MANRAASVLAKLKNESKRQNISLQQLLNLFYQEEFIRRISRSQYRDNLILKGGFLLYTLSEFAIRPTVDADYLLENYSNNMDSVETLVRDLISLPSQHDFMRFEIRNLEIISEIKDYHGIRVNLTGYMGRTRTPFSIDFGVGDIIVPAAILKRWSNFCKKILKYKLGFGQVVEVIIDFVQPPYESLIQEDEFFKTWSHEGKKYI